MRGYAKIGDFTGESTDSGHEGWSIITGLSSGLSHPMGVYSHAEGTKGSVQVASIVVEKETDSATVKLQRALLAREKIPKVEIHICGVISNKREPFLIYELEDVFATAFQFSARITEDGTIPTESVTFDFKKIKWTYNQYGADGKKQGKVTHEYKVGEKNKLSGEKAIPGIFHERHTRKHRGSSGPPVAASRDGQLCPQSARRIGARPCPPTRKTTSRSP